MTRITVDEQLAERLRQLSADVALYDPNGRILGFFAPIDPRMLVPQVSEEELDRRQREGGWRSLAEIMADLERKHGKSQ